MSVMTSPTTTTPTTETIETTEVRPGRVRTTVKVGAAAAVATTAAAGALHAMGVSFAIDGEMIPLAGFAQLTFVGAVIGGVLAACLRHRRFLQVTVALTALSCIPSVALPQDAATKLSLVALHVLAAVIVVPALARCTND
jgi:K+-transporting ATPase A subunit